MPVTPECAVVFCNHIARIQFDQLNYIDFPTDRTLRDIWWKLCGRKDKFNPTSRICSIHFASKIKGAYKGLKFKETIWTNNPVVLPTLYLRPNEYTKLTRKRQRDVNYMLIDECNQTKLVCKPEIMYVKNTISNASNINTISKIECTSTLQKLHGTLNIPTIMKIECTSTLQNLWDNEGLFEENISEEKYMMIPKSRNNGNDCDYIYLDMLDGEDVSKVLSLEKKKMRVPKNSNTEILKLLEKNHTNGISESIIHDEALKEYYDKMLPSNCDEDCQCLCFYSFPDSERIKIYNEFQMLNYATEQNCKITQLVNLHVIKKKDGTFENRQAYHFIRNKGPEMVCRTFFLATLGISIDRLNAIMKPMNYYWYSDSETAVKAHQKIQPKIIQRNL